MDRPLTVHQRIVLHAPAKNWELGSRISCSDGIGYSTFEYEFGKKFPSTSTFKNYDFNTTQNDS